MRRLVVCRRDYELTGNPEIDRHRYRRGQVIACLDGTVEPGAAVDASPYMQVIEVAGLTAAEAELLCATEYDTWRSGLGDSYFANPDDPRRSDDNPALYARRHRRIDIDAISLRKSLRDALAPSADHRTRPTATAAEMAAVTIRDERAARVPL